MLKLSLEITDFTFMLINILEKSNSQVLKMLMGCVFRSSFER